MNLNLLIICCILNGKLIHGVQNKTNDNGGWFEIVLGSKRQSLLSDDAIDLSEREYESRSTIPCRSDEAYVILQFKDKDNSFGSFDIINADDDLSCIHTVSDALVIRRSNGYSFIMPNFTNIDNSKLSPQAASYMTLVLNNNEKYALQKFDDRAEWGGWTIQPPNSIAPYGRDMYKVHDTALAGFETYATYFYNELPDVGKVTFKCISWFMGGSEFHVQFENEDAFRKQYNVKVELKIDNEPRYEVLFTPRAPQFRVYMAGDPQPYRTTDSNKDPNDNPEPWRRASQTIAQYLRAKDADVPAAFMMINGDMTEFGRLATFADYESVFHDTVGRIFWGLGNHDYANNVGDCWSFGGVGYDNCAMDMVKKQYQMQKEMQFGISNWESHSSDDSWGNLFGSFAYGFDYGNYRFYQLHNYPTYAVSLKDGLKWIEVKDSMEWLDSQLQKYADRWSIISLHDHRFNDNTQDMDRFFDMIKKYNVKLVFAGHLHTFSQSTYNDIQVHVSGALFDDVGGGYYDLKFEDNCVVGNADGPNSELSTLYHFQICW